MKFLPANYDFKYSIDLISDDWFDIDYFYFLRRTPREVGYLNESTFMSHFLRINDTWFRFGGIANSELRMVTIPSIQVTDFLKKLMEKTNDQTLWMQSQQHR